MKITDKERKVLEALVGESLSGGDMCITFSWIVVDTKLTLAEVRRACRSLKKKGLAEFHRGLMTEDGEVAGSGYCISISGEAFLKPCDVCGGRITYEYEATNGAQIRECDEHYEKSPKLAQPTPML